MVHHGVAMLGGHLCGPALELALAVGTIYGIYIASCWYHIGGHPVWPHRDDASLQTCIRRTDMHTAACGCWLQQSLVSDTMMMSP